MATKPSQNKGLGLVENTFGAFGYLFSGVIAVFIVILTLYYSLAIFSYAPPTVVQNPVYASGVGILASSPVGVIVIAFAMIGTFLILFVTLLSIIRSLRWFVRVYSAALHKLANFLFRKYNARQFVLVKVLVFAIEASLLLVAYVLYPTALLFGFLVSGAALLVTSLLCVAIQAVVVLSTRRAPSDIL